MTTLYNATALKKIKKNDLALMFLDLQARDYNSRMDDRKLTNVTPFLEEENKELKEELRAKDIALDIIKEENEVNKKNMFRFMAENKELKEQVKYLEAVTADTKYAIVLKEELEELEKENANYEADDNNLTKVMSMVNTQLEEADYDEAWASVDGIIDIITNILEDINILNDLNEGLTKMNDSMPEVLEEEFLVPLRAENKKLKEVIDSLKEENEELKDGFTKEEAAKFLEENDEQSSIIEKLDDRLVNLRAMEKDITLHPDYKRLVELN